jgi:colanic acid/amylovoran biosynthesis protein
VDLSGDTLTEDYGIHVTISHLFPILIGMSLQKPVVLYAQTIGPFRIMGPIVKPVLNKAALITVRESISRDYLRKIDIAKPCIHLTADSAFLLEPAGEERLKEIMLGEGIDEDDGPIIGMTLSRLIGHRFSIGHSGSKHSSFSALMAEVADHVIEKMGATVVFFSHVTGPTEGKDDRVMARQVWQRVKEKSKAKVIAGDYTPGEVKGIIGKCHLFIGVRMHSNISSASMYVPTIAISYSRKTPGIMKTIGQEKWVCHIDRLTFEELVSKIDEAWSSKEHIKAELVAHTKAVRQLAFRNAELVKELLEDIKKER